MKKNAKRISLLVMDVDGTLTDGQIHIFSEGELFKSFDAKDGYGIHNILPQYGITPVIITGRRSVIAERRAQELGIEYLYQGVADKAACLQELSVALDVPLSKVACIGDDLNDLTMMELCGISGCPADAAAKVKKTAQFVSARNGGHGAVREFIEWITEQKEDEEKKEDEREKY